MNLLEIKNYLTQVKMSSLATLSGYFKCEADLMRQMLEHWVRKGKVKKFNREMMCGGKCTQCGSCAMEIYEWVAV